MTSLWLEWTFSYADMGSASIFCTEAQVFLENSFILYNILLFLAPINSVIFLLHHLIIYWECPIYYARYKKYVCVCVYMCVLSCVQLFLIPWTLAWQAPLSMGILQARILEWVAMPSSRGSSHLRDRTQVSHIAGRFFTVWATRKTQSGGRAVSSWFWIGDLLPVRWMCWPLQLNRWPFGLMALFIFSIGVEF